MIYIKPVDVARQLGIADSTLRRYCNDFATHLSPDAAPEAGVRRRFRPSDVAMLKRAKELLDAGNTIEETNEVLALVGISTEEAEIAQEAPASAQPATDTTQALVSLLGGQVVAAQADQAQRLTRQDQELAELTATVGDLRERLARLEAQAEQMRRLQEQIDALEGQLKSIGQYMHDHSGLGRLGMRKVE